MASEIDRDLVVVIPGILGSRLVREHDGQRRTVWDLRATVLPRSLAALHRMGKEIEKSRGAWEPSPDEGIIADGLLSDPAWLPGFMGVDGYTGMAGRLREAVPGRLIEFPYDWRLSNAYTAERLRDSVMPRLETWRKERGNSQAKLILVCHSMGGLVARYFCEHLGGAANTRRIFTFGTPHRGSLKALAILVQGKRIGPFDVGRVARALPTVWELLPQYPCVVLGDKRTVHLQDAGLAELDDPRFHAARQFQQRIRQPAEARPRGTCPYQQTVFFGKIQTTIQYARATYTRNSATITVLKPGEDDSRDDGGDGTVPSFASFPIELDVSSGGIPLLDKHAAMPAREAALENLVNELNPMDISGLKAVDSTAPDLEGHISVLDVPSEARAGDAVPVQVVSSKSEVVIQLVDHVRGTVTNTMTEQLFADDPRGGIPSACDVGPLAPGTYTIVARTPGRAVSDHLFIWDGSSPPTPAVGGELADLL